MVLFLKPICMLATVGGFEVHNTEIASLIQSTKLFSETVTSDGSISRSLAAGNSVSTVAAVTGIVASVASNQTVEAAIAYKERQDAELDAAFDAFVRCENEAECENIHEAIAFLSDADTEDEEILLQLTAAEFKIIAMRAKMPEGWAVSTAAIAKANLETVQQVMSQSDTDVTLTNGKISKDGDIERGFYCRKCGGRLIYKLPEETDSEPEDRETESPDPRKYSRPRPVTVTPSETADYHLSTCQDCGDGSSLDSAEACEQAAKAVGGVYRGVMDRSYYGGGCTVYYVHRNIPQIKYNKHEKAFMEKRSVCKNTDTGEYVKATCANGCPEGFGSIDNKADCEAAKRELKSSDGQSNDFFRVRLYNSDYAVGGCTVERMLKYKGKIYTSWKFNGKKGKPVPPSSVCKST